MCQFSLSQSKVLHLPTQSIAIANAKLCNRQRKALHLSTHSFWSFWLNVIVSFGIHLCIEGQRAKGEVLREKGIFALRLLSSQAITPLSP